MTFTRAGAIRYGIRRALSLPAWIVAASLLGVGPLALNAGFSLGAAMFSTVAIWAGPAQIILFTMLTAQAPWPLIVLAVALSAIRLMPLTMTIMPLLKHGPPRVGTQLLAAHVTAITVWVEGMRTLPRLDPAVRLPYHLAFAFTCVAVSAVATGFGYLAAAHLPQVVAASLLFISPLFFAFALVDNARNRADVTALISGFVAAPALSVLATPTVALMVVGLAGGGLAYWVDRRRRAA